MTTRKTTLLMILALALVALGVTPALADETARVARVDAGIDSIAFQPEMAHDGMTITVTGPYDFVERHEVSADRAGYFDTAGLADGFYRYHITAAPVLDDATRRALTEARQNGNSAEVAAQLRYQGKLVEGAQQSGNFRIVNGAIVDAGLVEAGGALTDGTRSGGVEAATGGLSNLTEETQVIAMDLIVQGSECVGQDCTSSENFGFDTIRLKENNLRIKFQDTSNSGSFPSNDWTLAANETNNGGANKFFIEDVDAGRIPFTLEAGAPNNSLYVDDAGNIGIGTNAPAVEVHVKDGDSPTLRLEQDQSSGFAAQTWDVAGNETNFFVRDVNNGSLLPFKIFPGAATNTLTLSGADRVGVGIQSAGAKLEVRTSDANSVPGLLVTSTASSSAQDMLTLTATGDVNVRTNFSGDTANAGGWTWQQIYRNNQYNLSLNDDGDDELILNAAGDLTVTGSMNATAFNMTSDRNAKENFGAVETTDVLERLAQLPVQRWNYISDDKATEHIGVMAQDFHAAFGVGIDDKHIATVDADGVAFAAIQALYQRLQEKEAALEELRSRLEALEGMEP